MEQSRFQVKPREDDYRGALRAAERALMNAAKWLHKDSPTYALVREALAEVTRVLDIGRDEDNEQGCS